jgi:hypothetical protein
MKNLTLKQAQEKTIFYFDYSGKIKTMNLADFIFESTKETTTPKGVGRVLHIREQQDDSGNIEKYNIYEWYFSNLRFIESFETLEEAEECIFKYACYDFDKDDQRDTRFFDTLEEAEEEEAEQYANNFGVKLDTAKSIVRKQKLIDLVR